MTWRKRMRSVFWLTGMLAAVRPAHAIDFPACTAYPDAEVIFVGRPQPPIKRWLTYDFGIVLSRYDRP